MTMRLLAALVLAGSLVRPRAAQDVGLLIGLSHESAYDSIRAAPDALDHGHRWGSATDH